MIKYWQAYQTRPASQLADVSKANHLRLTFSRSPKQTTATLDRQSDTSEAPLSKQAFAKEVCTYFKTHCSYQTFEQSHGEVFTTSLLESLKRF